MDADFESTGDKMWELKADLLANPRGAKHYWSTLGEIMAVHQIVTCLKGHKIRIVEVGSTVEDLRMATKRPLN